MSTTPLSPHTTPSRPDIQKQRHESTIAERQNEPATLRLLAAQRQLYSEAKTWQTIRTWSVMGVATFGVVATIFAPSWLLAMGILGAVTTVAQWVALQFIRQRTSVAAAIQELFDTTVLDLPWNTHLVKKPELETVVAADARHHGDRASLIDWYTVPAAADFPFGALLAQRTNVRWDSTLRQTYATTILIGMVLLLALVTVIGMVKELTLGEFGLALLPSVGALVMGYETVHSHRRHATGQTELRARIESTWAKAVANRRTVKLADLRSIQDEIYRFRTLAPPVPDWYYRRLRDQFEHETEVALESMWQDVQAHRSPARDRRADG